MSEKFTTDFAGRQIEVEAGHYAQLANGSAFIRYGDTVVLVTATASQKPREGVDFFPLSVDYEERLYAVGKIPGSFIRREGKPTEKAIITGRSIDRPLRPLFPDDFRNDVSVVATVLSVDQDNSPEIASVIGASIALTISDIPFNGPIGAVVVGLIEGRFIANPNTSEREHSDLNLTVAGTKDKIIMIECGAKQVSEDVMLEAIQFAHVHIKKMCDFINEIADKVGKPKMQYQQFIIDEEVFKAVKQYAEGRMVDIVYTTDKQEREKDFELFYEEVSQHFADMYPDKQADILNSLNKIEKQLVRNMILKENKRPDGRRFDEIRPLWADVSILPRVHGSGLFQRGQTQVLTALTLGAVGDVQLLDGIEEEETKRYMHHYNFPGYSVGEAKPTRGPGRREIGHGALAERALEPIIPDESEFPYTLRLVSEVLMSNGSTSQASVCGSTLALMDAGVPIKAPVAGISIGLVTENDDSRYVLLTDIQGIEDFYGDMDFKVAGTDKGITAIQVDVKIDGLTIDIIKAAFEQARKARTYIIHEIILKAIPQPRPTLSEYAPKIFTTTIDPEKIREVIGAGGKIINKIIAETGTKIDIEDDGRVFVTATDEMACQKALCMIEGIAKDVEPGQIYVGKVVRIMNFGAFVEFLPGKEGLVHISKLDKKRVAKVEDVVNIGDEIVVKVLDIDKQGRINLSRKDAMDSADTM